jgi:hypothetical protein
MDQRDFEDTTAAESKLELAYNAYAALLTAMNDLATSTFTSKASHLPN